MLKFTKMQGCGNDFVVVDGRESAGKAGLPLSAQAVRAVCDRHFGVGADGVLVIEPATDERAVARMRVLNADGSEAEMCGNGIRCVAKYLYERDARLRLPELPIETASGIRACQLTTDARRHVTQVAVSLGQPRLDRGAIPMTGPGPAGERAIDVPLVVEGREFRLTAVSLGNPHAVLLIDGSEPLRELAERFGASIEHHAWFPRGVNVGFARPAGSGIELVVWERGCGITLACGTGAGAAVVAACLNGRAPRGREVKVMLPGGTLGITFSQDGTEVTLRGPACEVFESAIDTAPLPR